MTIPLTHIAKGLRHRQTDAERLVWARLRDRRMDGLKFRRQVPRGPFVVDFLCDEAMLIVELDGSQHADAIIAQRDDERSRYLINLGYEVIRIWNVDVYSNLFGVLEGIHAKATDRRKAPSSGLRPPSPLGEKDGGDGFSTPQARICGGGADKQVSGIETALSNRWLRTGAEQKRS